MGDQRLELKIQQEEDDFSKPEESKMRMILNEGWRLGKKIVITGMAISSAPIVLPPLVIFSSIGFAVAVPFGFVFVSYAFTEKLMSKLLSIPLNPPSLFEYKIYDDNDYEEDEEDFEEVGLEEEEEEEKKFREDSKEPLKMRIELIGAVKEDEGFVVDWNEEKPVEDMDEVVEEESRESLYFDDYMEEEEKPGEDMNEVMEEERDNYVEEEEEEEEEKPGEDMNEVVEEERDNYVEEEEKPGEDMNEVMEEERVDGSYCDNYVEEDEKPGEYVNGLMEEERADGTYFDYYVEEEETPGEDMNGVMEEEKDDGTYFDKYVEEEEKPGEYVNGLIEEEEEGADGTCLDNNVEEEKIPGEDMNGVMEEDRADGIGNNVEAEEKSVEEDMGGIEMENLTRGTGGVVEDYIEDKEEAGETIKEEGEAVEVISGETKEEALVPIEREEAGDEENADIAIAFEEGVNENVGNIEEEKEEKRPVIETEGVVEESRDQENVVMSVVQEEKSVLGMEGEKREESEGIAMPTFSSSLPQRKGRKRKGKKHVKETAENMEEENRLVREAKGGLGDSRDKEPLDKLNVEEKNTEEIGGGQNVNGMAQENHIVAQELPSPRVEIVGVIDEGNVNYVTQDDAIVEEVVPVTVVDVAQKGDIVEVAVPVLDTVQEETVPVVEAMQEDNVEKGPVDVTQVGYIEEAVPVAEISRVVEKEKFNDVAAEDYIVQQVVPVVEINGGTPVAEMNRMSTEENRGDESVDKISNDGGAVLENNTDNEEIPVEEVHGIDKVHEGVNSVLEPIGMKEERRSEEILDRVPEVVVKPVAEMGEVVEGTQDEEEVDKIVLSDTNAVLTERRDKGITDIMVEEEKKHIVETEKKWAPSQTEHAREIADKSGLDVFDSQIEDADEPKSQGSVKSLDLEADSEPRNVSLEQVSIVKEPTTQKKEMANSAGHPLSVEMTESKFDKEAHEQEGVIPSKEVLYNEDKIWEHLNAMRKIVGYKASLQATCIEELKALYVFIGVEPPVAFKVPSDLAEINDKLRLLMSIIGVK